MGKLKWVTKSVSFSCQDLPKFTKRRQLSVSFPSAFRQLSVSFSCYPFSLTGFGATEYLVDCPEVNVSAGRARRCR